MTEHLYPSFSLMLVDDELPWLRSLRMALEGPGGITNTIVCSDSREVLPLLASGGIGLVLLDLTMPHMSGQELLDRIVEEYPDVAVIVVSGLNQIETAVNCMRHGAFDYLVKTMGEERILDTVRRAIRMQELLLENRAMRNSFLSDRLDHPEIFSGIVTGSKVMRSIFQYIEAVACSSQPILITGESGVGKELAARAIHALSRPGEPMVSVNVAGLDDSVFADTLFGHRKGAFTGADEARKGMIESAGDGTLFLDEVGDLALPSQVKLLRLLQEGEYYPLGSDSPKQIRARIVVATHRDLAEKQAQGGFRKDLFYRLRTHHVHLPPLRERKEDLPLLLDHFLSEFSHSQGKKKPAYPRELLSLLETYHYPGNLRELKSMIHDAVSTHSSGTLSMESFLRSMGLSGEQTLIRQPDAASENPFSGCERLPTITEAVDLLVAEAIQRSGNNQTLAARMIGISQPAMSKRLRR